MEFGVWVWKSFGLLEIHCQTARTVLYTYDLVGVFGLHVLISVTYQSPYAHIILGYHRRDHIAVSASEWQEAANLYVQCMYEQNY